MLKNFKSGIVGLVLGVASLIPIARADSFNNVSLDPYVTNNVTINWDASCWTNAYLIQATSTNFAKGYVLGDTNSWIEAESNATLEAIASSYDTKFAGWISTYNGIPSGVDTNSSTISFIANKPYTLVANFVDKTSVTNPVDSSKAYVSNDVFCLEISAITDSNSTYQIDSTTNFTDWNFETNAKGNDAVLRFELPLDKKVKYFKATKLSKQ